jgi:hypothetical protein
MTEQQIANALAFLARVQISGQEAFAFIDVCQAIKALSEKASDD